MSNSHNVPLHFLKDVGPLIEVKDIMSVPITIPPQRTVAQAIDKMKKDHISSLVVVGKNKKVVGILTEKDILHKVLIYRKNPNKVLAEKIMTSSVLTISPEITVLAAGRLMNRKKIRRLVVLESHRLQGIITQTDVAHVISCFGIWRDVRDIMSTDVATFPHDRSVTEAADLMHKKKVSSVLITKNKRAVGVLTEKDFVRKIAGQGKNPLQMKVKDIMSSPVISIPPSFSVFKACRLMEKHKIRRTVVMKKGSLKGNIKGNILGVVTKTDIFRAFDEKLSMFEDKYFESLNRVPYGFFLADSKMRVKFVNKTFMEVFAVDDVNKVLNKPLLPPPAWSHVNERKLLFNILSRKQVLECSDVSLKDVSGTIKHIGMYCISLKKIDGEILGYQGVILDRTIQEEVLEKLKESEEQFKDLSENVDDLIQSVDAKGEFVYVNKKWKKVLGYSDNEIKNLNLMDIIRKDHLPYCMQIFKKVCRGESFKNINTVFVTKKGKEVIVNGNVNARMKKGRFISTRAIFRDVTEQRKAKEELREKTEKVCEFNKFTVGRELKMIELKKRIKELENKLNRKILSKAEA